MKKADHHVWKYRFESLEGIGVDAEESNETGKIISCFQTTCEKLFGPGKYYRVVEPKTDHPKASYIQRLETVVVGRVTLLHKRRIFK